MEIRKLVLRNLTIGVLCGHAYLYMTSGSTDIKNSLDSW